MFIRALSYTCVKKQYDPRQCGLHSLRAGGATTAANAVVPGCLFESHGR